MKVKKISGKVFDFYINRYQELAGIPKAEPYPPIKEMLAHLMNIPDYVYALYGFVRDPLKGKVSASEKEHILNTCMAEAEKYALDLKAQYKNCVPSLIAEKMGLKVMRPDMPKHSDRVVFAEFEEPGTIRVYQNAIQHAQKAIKQDELDDIFKNINIEEVMVAHELFHFVEMQHANEIYSLNKKITLWKLGSFEYKSTLSSLREIAAMSFAKVLVNIDFSPYLFDVFLAYCYQSDAGGNLYNEIAKLEKENCVQENEENLT